MWGRKKEKGGPPFSPLADMGGGLAQPAFPSSSFPASAAFGGAGTETLPSLRDMVKKRLLNDMIRSFAGESNGVVMLVDTFTLRVLSSVCKMSELLEENIHLVENITMKQNGAYLQRQPLPALPACYFLTPTIESVNRLIADFRDKKRPMYASCHLYFSSRLPDVLLGKLKASAAIGRVASFKEINLEVACMESNAFVLDSPDSLAALFAPEESPAATEVKVQEQHRLASMLATLCVTLGEMPNIRHANRPVASSVAQILNTKLSDIAKLNSGFPSRTQSVSERPTVLILDRSSDALSPLLHEFTYQAMVHDLLPVQEERYKYTYVGNQNQKLTKEVLLNETDPLWTRLRALHIADLGQLLHAEYKQFIADNPAMAKLAKQGGDKELKAMTEGLRGMPKFQETSARYSLHMALTQELMKKYTEASLELVATLEQNMANGEDSGGKAFKTALPELRALLERADLPLSPTDKMRLLMIYMITQEGIRQDERRQLIQLAGISPEDQDAIINLFFLNVTLLQGTAKTKRAGPKKESGAEGYDVSRYSPPLKRVLEDALSPAGLSVADFPYVDETMTAARDERTTGKQKGKGGGGADCAPVSGRRLIVFMLGGMSYSELRSVHEVERTRNRDIVAGSTCMLTPQMFLLALKKMKQLEPETLV